MINIKHIVPIVRLFLLKRKARKLARKERDEYFIVKLQGVPALLSKSQFKAARQRGHFPKHFTAEKLKKIALYYTKGNSDDKKGVQRPAGKV